MSDTDDDVVKPIKRISSQQILEKSELVEIKIDELINKPKQHNQPMDKDSDVFRIRNVYVNTLNNKDIMFPKRETLEYSDVN